MYLFKTSSGKWVFGKTIKSTCSAGSYRLDPNADFSVVEIYHLQSNSLFFSGAPTVFLKESGTAYADFTEFFTACEDFFFKLDTLSDAELELASSTFYNKTEIDALMVGRVKKVFVDNTQHNNTGNTTENTVLTGTIPASSIGVNGSFHIIMLISTLNNNANAKTIRVKFNGNTVCQGVTISTLSYQTYSILHNRNSASSQIAMYFASAASGSFATGTGTAPSTFTINTAADITVTVTIQNGTGSDTVSLETIEILAIP